MWLVGSLAVLGCGTLRLCGLGAGVRIGASAAQAPEVSVGEESTAVRLPFTRRLGIGEVSSERTGSVP